MARTGQVDIVAKTQEMANRAKAKATASADNSAQQPGESSSTTAPYQLPIWPNKVRSLPNSFARSALFTVGNHRAPRRQFTKPLEDDLDLQESIEKGSKSKSNIETLTNISILYIGEELRQDDEDVFLQALHLAREKSVLPEEPTVEFTAGAMIKALGWAHNKRSYDRLKASLDRMVDGTVQVSIKNKRGFRGHLMRKALWEEDDGSPSRRWRVYFEPEIVKLFGPDDYSQLSWDLRLSLTPMEKWLHSFYSSHEKPYPYSVALLRNLCGAASAELRGFRRTLKSALNTLVEKGFLKDFQIDTGDLVHISRANVGNGAHLLGR